MAKITRGAARSAVKDGLLGVGEDHYKPDGRRFVLDLIRNKSLSKDLYIEIPSSSTAALLLYKEKSGEGPYDETTLTGISKSFYPNEIPLGRVIAAAWEQGVYVAGVDAEAATDETVTAMNERDGTIAKRVRELQRITGLDGKNCVILYGSWHFEDNRENTSGIDRVTLTHWLPHMNYVIFEPEKLKQ